MIFARLLLIIENSSIENMKNSLKPTMNFCFKKKASDRNLLIRNIETKNVLFEIDSTYF